MQASRLHTLTKAGRVHVASTHQHPAHVIVTSPRLASHIQTAAISTCARGIIPSKSTNNKSLSRISQINRHITTSSRLLNSMSTNNDQFQLNNLFDVKGKVALVTGGGSGIGLMAVQALAGM